MWLIYHTLDVLPTPPARIAPPTFVAWRVQFFALEGRILFNIYP